MMILSMEKLGCFMNGAERVWVSEREKGNGGLKRLTGL